MHDVVKKEVTSSRAGARSGKDGWKAVLCVVFNRPLVINTRTVSVASTRTAWRKNVANISAVAIREAFAPAALSPFTPLSLEVVGAGRGVCPLQLALRPREKYQVDSRRWPFNALGLALKPEVCVLLYVGRTLGPTLIYHLWKLFDILRVPPQALPNDAPGDLRLKKDFTWPEDVECRVPASHYLSTSDI